MGVGGGRGKIMVQSISDPCLGYWHIALLSSALNSTGYVIVWYLCWRLAGKVAFLVRLEFCRFSPVRKYRCVKSSSLKRLLCDGSGVAVEYAGGGRNTPRRKRSTPRCSKSLSAAAFDLHSGCLPCSNCGVCVRWMGRGCRLCAR